MPRFRCSWLISTLVLVVLAGAGLGARATAAAVDAAAVQAEPLTPFVALLEDPEGELTLQDVTRPDQAARFEPAQSGAAAFALGFTRSAYWMRLSLRNPGELPLQRMLVVDNPRISHVQSYLPDKQGVDRTIRTGSDTPFDTRAYPNRSFVFPLNLPARSEQEVYLRVQSTIGLLVPVQLWRPEAFHAHERSDYSVQAWYFGIATAMFLFNLMLFAALRDRIYLFYLTFLACSVGTLAVKNGLAGEFFPGSAFVNSNVAYWSGASLALASFLLFMRRMLDTSRILPRTDRALLGLVLIYLCTLPVYALDLPAVARAAIVLNLLTVPVALGVGLAAAYKRQRSAYFFLVAFLLLMLGTALTALRAMGVLPTNAFTVDGLQFGSALEMLTLAFALADRYNQMRRDKARAQEALLQTQQQLVETLRSSERELELRVVQRTVELQLLNSRLATLSLTDDLTGIPNRRRFEEVLGQEWRRAQRQQQPLALAVIDVDWFKPYNDHYGHPAGDACLREIARTLLATVTRTGDLVARYGGEEFVFLAPATDGASAQTIAQKLVQAVAELALPHAQSPLGHITVSVGVAGVLPGPDDKPDRLVALADEALYQAKAQGRNRVILAQG